MTIGTKPREEDAHETMTAYYIRRENRSEAAVAARTKLAAEKVQKVATPWRVHRRIGESAAAAEAEEKIMRANKSRGGAARAQDWDDDEEAAYWADPEVQRVTARVAVTPPK